MKPEEKKNTPKVDPKEMEAYMDLALSSQDEGVKAAMESASSYQGKNY